MGLRWNPGGEVAMEFGDHDRHLGGIEVEAQCRADRAAEQSVNQVHTRGLRSSSGFSSRMTRSRTRSTPA